MFVLDYYVSMEQTGECYKMSYIPHKYIKNKVALGTSILTDGDLEIWTDSSTLTNWTFVDLGSGATLTQESTEVYHGTYSAKLTADASGAPGYIYQTHTGLTENDYYTISAAGKVGTCTSVALFILNGTLGTATKEFDLDNNVWVDFTGNPVKSIVISDADWKLKTFNVPVPASEIISIIAITNGSANTYGYVDYLSMQQYVRYDAQVSQNQIFYYYTFENIDLSQYGTKILMQIPAGLKLNPLYYSLELESIPDNVVAGALNLGTNSPNFDNIIDGHTEIPTDLNSIVRLEKTSNTEEHMPNDGDYLVLNISTPWEADQQVLVKLHLVCTTVKINSSGPSIEV